MKKGDRLSAMDWLDLADYDLKMAEWAREGEFWAGACFHSQQAAEKALKAYLVYNRIVPKKTHILAMLIEACSSIDASFRDMTEQLKTLDKYYISTRYPVHFPSGYTKNDTEEAIEIAKQVIELVKQKIH